VGISEDVNALGWHTAMGIVSASLASANRRLSYS